MDIFITGKDFLDQISMASEGISYQKFLKISFE